MKIVRTFEVVNESLYSVLYDNESGACDEDGNAIPDEQLHEFSRLFDFWNDQDKLRTFFEDNEQDLNEEYWEGISIDDAIKKTRKEALDLESLLIEYAESENLHKQNLSMLFRPLTNGRIVKQFEKDKAKVDGKKTWLRIYAIRIEANLFVICGGAIKLRATLNDRDYLLNELEKLEVTRDYLKLGDNDLLEIFELQ